MLKTIINIFLGIAGPATEYLREDPVCPPSSKSEATIITLFHALYFLRFACEIGVNEGTESQDVKYESFITYSFVCCLLWINE